MIFLILELKLKYSQETEEKQSEDKNLEDILNQKQIPEDKTLNDKGVAKG